MPYIQHNSPLAKVLKTTNGRGRNFRTTEEVAGITSTGATKYKEGNPGSKLKTAVTGNDKPNTCLLYTSDAADDRIRLVFNFSQTNHKN